MNQNNFEDSLERHDLPRSLLREYGTSTSRSQEAQYEIERIKKYYENERTLYIQETALKYTQYEARIESLKLLLSKLRPAAKPEVKLELKDAQEFAKKLEALQREYEAKIATLHEKLSESELMCKIMSEKNIELEQQIVTLDKENIDLKKQADVKILQLQEELSEKMVNLDKLEKECEKSSSVVTSLEIVVNEYKRNEECLKAQINSLESLLKHTPSCKKERKMLKTLKKSATTSKLTNDLVSPLESPKPEPATSRKENMRPSHSCERAKNLPLSIQYQKLQSTLRNNLCENYVPDKNDKLDRLFAHCIKKARVPLTITKLGSGQYQLGTRKISATIQNDNLVVRVGGGYMLVEDFLGEFFPTEIGTERKKCQPSFLFGSTQTRNSALESIGEINNNPKSVCDMPRVVVKRLRSDSKINARSRSPVGSVNGTTRTSALNEKEIGSIVSIKTFNGKVLKPYKGRSVLRKCPFTVSSEARNTPRAFADQILFMYSLQLYTH
eukprot:TRINITY_DN1616_c0_g1_i1.p1 TRINITY_DN1616_c0_g1~~TRINITY_DN1616_c0_g1_i1.p1  ORF type:complete len:499 (+),score=44.74 TRINITY_DN1616_c0_g1_i1:3622-5118(+)